MALQGQTFISLSTDKYIYCYCVTDLARNSNDNLIIIRSLTESPFLICCMLIRLVRRVLYDKVDIEVDYFQCFHV